MIIPGYRYQIEQELIECLKQYDISSALRATSELICQGGSVDRMTIWAEALMHIDMAILEADALEAEEALKAEAIEEAEEEALEANYALEY